MIRLNKSISKAELSKVTGLSPTAIGVIVSNLLEEGFIHEVGTGKSKGGRKPVLLQIRPDSFYSLGVEIEPNYIRLVIVGLAGNVVYEKNYKTPSSLNIVHVINAVEDYIDHGLKHTSIDVSKVLGIGFSVPGLIDPDRKDIILAPNLNWKNINISKYIKKYSNLPIYIENESMAFAICENWLGSCVDTEDFVCINIKSGIGAGIFINRKLYRGVSGSAGEVGHIVVDDNGPLCGCGSYGCLETMASTKRILERAIVLIREGVISSVDDIDNITLNDIVSASMNGDENCRRILMEAAKFIGIAVSYVVNTLNPSKVILGGEFLNYSHLCIEEVKNTVYRKALTLPSQKVVIEATNLGYKASVLGAAIVVFKKLFIF